MRYWTWPQLIPNEDIAFRWAQPYLYSVIGVEIQPGPITTSSVKSDWGLPVDQVRSRRTTYKERAQGTTVTAYMLIPVSFRYQYRDCPNNLHNTLTTVHIRKGHITTQIQVHLDNTSNTIATNSTKANISALSKAILWHRMRDSLPTYRCMNPPTHCQDIGLHQIGIEKYIWSQDTDCHQEYHWDWHFHIDTTKTDHNQGCRGLTVSLDPLGTNPLGTKHWHWLPLRDHLSCLQHICSLSKRSSILLNKWMQ